MPLLKVLISRQFQVKVRKAYRVTMDAADVLPMPGGPLSSTAFFFRSGGLPVLFLGAGGSSFLRWIPSLRRPVCQAQGG